MKKLNALALLGLMVLVSCQKEVSDTSSPKVVNNFNELEAPQGFTFNATKTVSLNFTINNPQYSQGYTFEIYSGTPFAEGDLLYKGFTKDGQLNATVNLPTALKKLFVLQKDPTGSSTTEIIEVNSNSITRSFGKKSVTKKTLVVSPTCSSGCGTSYNNKGGSVNINNNDPSGVYCFTGNTTASINVNRSGVTIRICGMANIKNLNLNQGAKLQIVDGANVTIKNLGANSGSQVDIYDADVTINNNLSPNGPVTNHGDLTISKSLNINNGSGLTNNGSIAVGDHLNNNDNLVNNGSIVVDDDANMNGGSTTTNNCKLIVGQELRINNTIANHGYIEAGQDVKINGGSNLDMHDGAMLYGKSGAHINAVIDAFSNTSLLKFNGNVTINGGAGISGNMELCVGGSFTNYGSINNPASIACNQVYIPTSGCNPTGNGTPAVLDSDNDNVPDNNDLFPNDPERAGQFYFPGSHGFATIAFEDLWPGMGDYDFNDLVMDYRLRRITDANNNVKDIEIDYKVRAIGAGLKSGFGLQLDIAPAKVASVTRTTPLSNLITLNANGTEAGQSKTVLIFFDNANDELPNPGSAFVNTVPGSAYSTPKVSQVKVTFTTAESPASLSGFNPFMFVNQDRGREIHMPNYPPTDLANISLFGNAMDDSDPASGRYYVNENNLPWVITTPVSLDYPAEKSDIVKAYKYFAAWAMSGGNSNTDWYINNSGYRDNALIY